MNVTVPVPRQLKRRKRCKTIGGRSFFSGEEVTNAFLCVISRKTENLLKAAELQQQYRRPWWQLILGDKCCTQTPSPPSHPRNGSVFLHMFRICVPPEASHPSMCVFFSVRCTDLAAVNGSSRRLSVSLRSYYVNYFQPATVETKADLISGIRSEIRTIYNNAIGFFVGLRRCVCGVGGGHARTGQPARHWRGLRPALPPPRGG